MEFLFDENESIMKDMYALFDEEGMIETSHGVKFKENHVIKTENGVKLILKNSYSKRYINNDKAQVEFLKVNDLNGALVIFNSLKNLCLCLGKINSMLESEEINNILNWNGQQLNITINNQSNMNYLYFVTKEKVNDLHVFILTTSKYNKENADLNYAEN